MTYEYKKKDAADATYSIVTPTDAGEYTVRATVAETDDYADGTATANFTITQSTSGISDVKTDATEKAKWYDPSGRPLKGKPTKAGVYVKNGKKVVI